MWRVDHLPKGSRIPATTWHTCEDEALAEASRLRFSGLVNVVAWDDGTVSA